MPFPRPNLSDLRAQTAADINAALPGVDALLRYSNLGIIGDVLSALANGQYGYLDWIALQSVPFTATDEYLEGWAALRGVTRKPAIAASGSVSFTAAANAQVPAGTPINRADGVAYTTTADALAAAGQITVPVVAIDAGEAGNVSAGVTMYLGAGVSGVAASGATITALTGGVDIETDAELRNRMLIAYAAPPQGGSITDYPAYALAVPGVTRAWLKPADEGTGTLTIYVMMDVVHSAFRGFPQGTNGCSHYETRGPAATGDQLTIADAVFAKQSVIALVYVKAPTPNNVTLTITGIDPADALKQASIFSAVDRALQANAAPGGVTDLSAIEAAIAAVPGTSGFVIISATASAGTFDPPGVGNIVSNSGALPVLTLINWS